MKMDEGEDEPEIVLLGPSQFMNQNFITSFPDLSLSPSLSQTHTVKEEKRMTIIRMMGFKA